MTLEQYIAANPTNQVTVARNVQVGEDARLRVTIEQRRGPYKPVVLGVYVVASVKEALKIVTERYAQEETKSNGDKA